jgi:hypothetical protein
MIHEVPCARTTSIEIRRLERPSEFGHFRPVEDGFDDGETLRGGVVRDQHRCPDESDEARWPSRAATKLFDDLNPEPQGEIFSLRSPELRPQLLLIPLPQDVDVETRAPGKRHNVLAIAIDVAGQLGKYEVVALERLQTEPCEPLVKRLTRMARLERDNWLGGRDSNPDTVVQRRPKKRR